MRDQLPFTLQSHSFSIAAGCSQCPLGSDWSSLLAPPSEAVLLLSSRPSLPSFLCLSPDSYATEGLCAPVARTGCQLSPSEGEAIFRNGLVNCKKKKKKYARRQRIKNPSSKRSLCYRVQRVTWEENSSPKPQSNLQNQVSPRGPPHLPQTCQRCPSPSKTQKVRPGHRGSTWLSHGKCTEEDETSLLSA